MAAAAAAKTTNANGNGNGNGNGNRERNGNRDSNSNRKSDINSENDISTLLNISWDDELLEQDDPWAFYKTKYRLSNNFNFVQQRPIFSQRGATCGSDSIATILFESDIIKHYLGKVNLEKCKRDASIACVFKGIKTRRARMFAREKPFTANPVIRRSESVSNLLGEKIRKKMTCGMKKGADNKPLFDFLSKIFIENYYKIPKINEYFKIGSFGVFQENFPTAEEQEKLIAFMIHVDYYVKGKRKGHAIGFIKNGEDWYILDNNIGFMHKVLDLEWFNHVFLKRLFNEKIYKGSEWRDKIEPAEDYALLYKPKKEETKGKLHEYHINYQIITLGEKFYPNIPLDDVLGIDSFDFQKPVNVIWISYNGPPVTSDTGGAGAGAGSSVRKGKGKRTRKGGARSARKTRKND